MEEKDQITVIVEDLCEYALDREDVKWVADATPDSEDFNLNKLEYELHLLKIVSVGWSISYYLQDDASRDAVIEPFWKNIHDVSGDLSHATSLLIGADINYFEILRSRLDSYVKAMSMEKGDNPATVIGPCFAEFCGNSQNLIASMAGSKIFMAAVSGVKNYLNAAGYKI
ncbi:MAG: hypothetical protein D5R98_09595 [Desulfonatronovibrio sp. MSAO_Bac4]|nr:MAG: hypothetical protein D5R98_09595 [Desulfonatronovibrio sp. MSAO_Bac4]